MRFEDTVTSPNVELSQTPSPQESDVSDFQPPNNNSHRSQNFGTSRGPTRSSQPPPRTIPWSLWMYKTRWLRDIDASDLAGSIHGMRLATRVMLPPPAQVRFPPDPPKDTSSHVFPLPRTRIYDFNLRPYARVPNAIPYLDNLELDPLHRLS